MAQPPVTAKGKTFLVIEADQKMVAAIRRYLTGEGARQIFVEDSSRNAIQTLGAASPPVDCVICAEDVAPFTGIEFLKGIRTGKYSDAPYVRGVPFVLVTAHRERALVEACKALSADAYVVKPIDINTFLRHIHFALSHERTLASEAQYMSVDITTAMRLPLVLRHTWANPVKMPEARKT